MNLVLNKKATLNYEILETYEAGIELAGYEIKSLRAKHGSLEGAYIIIRGGEAFLIGATIPPFQVNNTPKSYESDRNRKLILHKQQLFKLSALETKQGLTIIPLSIYVKGRWAKVQVCVVRGKNKFDKRQSIKKRDTEREIRREFGI